MSNTDAENQEPEQRQPETMEPEIKEPEAQEPEAQEPEPEAQEAEPEAQEAEPEPLAVKRFLASELEKKGPEKKGPEKKRDEALVERLMRRMITGLGAVVDKKLGRETPPQTSFTTTRLIERMKRLIEERVRDEGERGRIAPHHFKLKVEWGTHSEAPPETIKELEHEVLAAAIDYINDQRLRTLGPVQVETSVDIFTSGIVVEPTFGEFEEELRRQDEARRLAEEGLPVPAQSSLAPREVSITARVTAPGQSFEKVLQFKPGGRRLSVGRVADNELSLNHPSVSKIHAALVINREGTLLVADTGSTNGTFINGRRIGYGEARPVEEGDVVGFGDVEVRFKRK